MPEAETSEIEGLPLDDFQRQKEERKIARRRSFWQQFRRRTWLQGVVDENNNPYPSPEASADALRLHWGEVFCEQQEDRSQWPELLSFVRQ
eukprot:5151334-Pyramimonas_sp.AAC.1